MAAKKEKGFLGEKGPTARESLDYAKKQKLNKIREVPLPKKPTGFSSKTGGSKADEAIVSHITNNYSVTAAEARAIVGKVNDFVKRNSGPGKVGTADKAGEMLARATSKLPKKAK